MWVSKCMLRIILKREGSTLSSKVKDIDKPSVSNPDFIDLCD